MENQTETTPGSLKVEEKLEKKTIEQTETKVVEELKVVAEEVKKEEVKIVDEIKKEEEKIVDEIKKEVEEIKKEGLTDPKMNFFKPLNELTFADIFLWRNIYVSLALFISTITLITLVHCYGYSFVTLVGRILQVQVISFSLYFFIRRFMQGSEKVTNPFEHCQLSEERAVNFAKKAVTCINETVTHFTNILFFTCWKKTLKFLSLLQVACFFGNRMRGLNILLLLTIYQFTVPKIYEMKKKEIDQIFGIVQEKVTQQVDQLIAKIPPQYKEKLESVFGKKEKTE